MGLTGGSGAARVADMTVVILVALVGAIAFILWSNDRAATRLREAEQRITDEILKGANRYAEGYQVGVTQASELLTTATTETVGNVTKILMNEVVGSPEEVRLPDGTATTWEPAWTTWEETDKGVEDIGVGDSVFVDREFDDRVAAIGEGEQIIPGVPLPDMSGEKFDG